MAATLSSCSNCKLNCSKVIWAPRMTVMPHNHQMWAVIGQICKNQTVRLQLETLAATIQLNCAVPCSLRRRHGARRTIYPHRHGSLPQRGPAPNPCCRVRAHGARRAAPGRPGCARTSLAADDTRRAPSHPMSFRLVARPRDPVASSRGPASERQDQPFADRARRLRSASQQARLDPSPLLGGLPRYKPHIRIGLPR
jgi:hypothetical protein